ncbi:MAG: sulfite exporter TauE/SafE family protein [Candidatus Fonsibacter sp.]|nr:sulfite exporter TauE/SafE family protein [Candidatus Fonsibacter sp.]
MLSIIFFLVAAIYASVGFAGGTSYLALLTIYDVEYLLVPIIALTCNIIVASGNCFNYVRAGNLDIKFLTPYLLGSIPLAYVGGKFQITNDFFQILLFFCLTISSLLLLVQTRQYKLANQIIKKIPFIIAILIGAIIGLVSGIVGIGGGIILSPILFNLKAAQPEKIVMAASLFILINSIAGFLGQIQKFNDISQLQPYLYLPLAVLLGGQLGNFLNIKILRSHILALLTSLLVFIVAIRLGLKIFF